MEVVASESHVRDTSSSIVFTGLVRLCYRPQDGASDPVSRPLSPGTVPFYVRPTSCPVVDEAPPGVLFLGHRVPDLASLGREEDAVVVGSQTPFGFHTGPSRTRACRSKPPCHVETFHPHGLYLPLG